MNEPAPSTEAQANAALPEVPPKKRPLAVALKIVATLMMLGAITMVLLGSWLISESGVLMLICTAAWVGGFVLFIAARNWEMRKT